MPDGVVNRMMGTFDFRKLQKCAEREAAMRKNVYPKKGPITLKRMEEIEMMDAIAAHFKALADDEERRARND